MLLRDAKLELFLVCEMEQKQAIWFLKRKYLNINLLFIELLYRNQYHICNHAFLKKKTALFVWF